MNNICFIPARNSSTRLKNKNIASFRNGNLITNTIDQAIESNIFDTIFLSSNDLSILDIAKKYNHPNVCTHYRNDKEDQLLGVVRQAIPDLGIRADDTVCLLLVTCPLRSVDDIIGAHIVFEDVDRGHTVVSVKKNLNPVQMAFKVDVGGHLEPVFPDEFYRSTRKQDHIDTFYYNDAIIFDKAGEFMDYDRPNLYGKMPIPYLMPPERSIAIDYEFQLKMARYFGEDDGKI